MHDMSVAIVPKSDQLNADDLIAGPRTVRITSIKITANDEQKVAIHFEGDNGKPYKPCKSMCRVLVHGWGPDASRYIGRSMTLYRDPSVKWAGVEVGGIRISHLSDIDADLSIALTATKGKRTPYKVRKLTTPNTTSTTAAAMTPKQRLISIITAWSGCDPADAPSVAKMWLAARGHAGTIDDETATMLGDRAQMDMDAGVEFASTLDKPSAE